jgi:hypothetical protein
MRQDLRQEWSESEFRLAVLQVLLGARKLNPVSGGVSGSALMRVLNLEDAQVVAATLEKLQDEHLITVGERVFQITALGVDLVEKHFPDCTPYDWFQRLEERAARHSKNNQPPWAPGDGSGPWLPPQDPDDPSRVPKRGHPPNGAGETKLPLPIPP